MQFVTGEDPAARRRILGELLGRGGVAILASEAGSWRDLSRDGESVPADVALVRTARGGLCADASEDAAHALRQLHLRRLGLLSPRLSFDRVAIEIGTRMDTGAIAALFRTDLRIDAAYRLAGVVHAVGDGADFSGADTVQTYRVACADTVICEDTVDLKACVSVVAALNPLASVTTVSAFVSGDPGSWNVPVGAFDGDAAFRLRRECGLVPFKVAAGVALAGNPGNPRHSNAGEGPVARSLRMALPGQVDLMRIMEAIRDMGETHGRNLLRLSARFDVPHTDYPIAVDVVDGVLMNPAFAAAMPGGGSDICLTGLDIDVTATAARFAACRRDVANFNENMRVAV